MSRHTCIILFVLVLSFSALSTSMRARSDDLDVLVRELNQPETSNAAHAKILNLARKDYATRQYVSVRIPEMIARTESGVVLTNAVQLAGELRISAAVPALMDALVRVPFGNRLGLANVEWCLNDDDVGTALSRIGDDAVPPIVAKVLSGPVAKTRRRGVLILINMRSSTAEKALSAYGPREPDAKLKSTIEDVLAAWPDKTYCDAPSEQAKP